VQAAQNSIGVDGVQCPKAAGMFERQLRLLLLCWNTNGTWIRAGAKGGLALRVLSPDQHDRLGEVSSSRESFIRFYPPLKTTGLENGRR